jgi:hypothetical protein
MNLMDILQGQLSDDVLNQLSDHVGADKEQVSTAATGIFSSLLGGLANNASSEGGLSALGSALDRNHDGSMLDDVAGMVGSMLQGNSQGNNALNGAGMLGHILGDNQEATAQQVSQSSGLSMGQVMKMMPILAPIVMNVLGKAKNGGGLGLGDLASVIMGAASGGQQQGGGMGDILGSVLGSVMGGGQQQQGGGGAIASILGGLFGKG